MDRSQSMNEFEILALESSSERRRELLRSLTDLFLDGIDEQTDRETSLYADIACRVLDEVTEEARRELAERIAPLTRFPGGIVRKLATDVISVASPVLEDSPLLNERDLVAIAGTHSQAHLLAISRRRDLREAVTDVLVERGEKEVLHSVTANAGARFSRAGFNVLAEKSVGDTQLQECLISRTDMPNAVASKLASIVEGELGQRLGTVRAMNMEHEFEAYVAKAKKRLETALRGSHRERIDIQVLINDVRNGVQSLNAAVTRLAKDNRPVQLSWLLAAAAELPETIVSNALNKVNGLPIAVTCKALGLGVDAFRAVALMRCRRLNLPMLDADRLTEQYQGLHLAEAQRTLRFLKVRHGVAGEAPAA